MINTTRRSMMFWAGAGLPLLMSRASGASRQVTLTPEIASFSYIEASNAFRVEIRQGSGHRVELHVDEDLVPHLDVHTSGGKLKLGLKSSSWWHGGGDQRAVAIITIPSLRGYNGSGATRATMSGFRSTEPFDLELSGASRMEANFDSGDVRIELSGASKAILNGHGNALKVEASGASDANLAAFVVQRANLELSGASKMTVNTSGRLDVDSSGASHVRYVGNPQLGRIDSSGASSVRPER